MMGKNRVRGLVDSLSRLQEEACAGLWQRIESCLVGLVS